MPRYDCYHSRMVLVEFTMPEEFADYPAAERLALTLVINGKAALDINGKRTMLTSPSVLLASRDDKVELVGGDKLTAKTFSFHPTFVNTSLTFERLANGGFSEIADEHDNSLLNLFLSRDEFYNGAIELLPQTFPRVSELFDLIGREMEVKSSEHWSYNVRRYLIQALFLLQDAYADQKGYGMLPDDSITDIVLEFIHANYAKKISVDTLCGLAYVNRTTLTRKFKARTGKSPIDYLLHHRLNIACELLTHSKLSVSKIAEASGFKGEKYLL